jgi:hypothetical protein
MKSGTVISEERILGKFSCAGCRRTSPGAESALVTKTRASFWNTPRECPLRGGGGDR